MKSSLFVPTLLVSLIILAACVDEATPTPTPTPTSTPTLTSTPRPTPTATPSPTSMPTPTSTTTPQGPRWEEVARWGNGADGLRFISPNGIAIDAADHVYTTEFQGHRVRKFTPEGELLAEWGGPGSELGQLRAPTGIVVGPDGRIYVAESSGHRESRSSLPKARSWTLGARSAMGPVSSHLQ